MSLISDIDKSVLDRILFRRLPPPNRHNFARAQAMDGSMRKLLLLPVVLLTACASWDDEAAPCGDIEDAVARRACLARVLAEDQAREDNNGIGPPTCHPASIHPNPDRAPC